MSPTNVIYLRPSLDYDPSRPTSRNNLVAFSPDIIPLPSPQDPSLLVASYDTYVERPFGLKQEPAYIYVRGAATDKTQPASANVVVGAVKNELVLWPQLLNAATKVGSAMLSTTASSGVAVSDKPIKFTPNPDWPWDTQRTSFLAVSDDSFGKLKPAKNYKELLSGVAASPGIVLSNTHFADAYTNHGGPIFYAFTTRLRFFDDSGKPTKLELSAEAVGIPPGMSIKFSDFDVPKSIINLPWTPISSTTTAGVTFEVTDGFDVSMYVEIRKDSPDVAPPDYASISLVVSVVQQGHIVEQEVIGAEHVLFYSNLPHKLSTIGGELAVGSPGPKVQLRNDLAGSQPTSALLSAGETTESRTWIFDLSLPPGWSPTWQGVLQLVLTNWPVGGTIQLTTPVIVGGTHIGISPTTVTNPNQVEGIFFLGLQGPWDTSATVTWTRGNGPDLQPGSKICVSIARIIDDPPLLKQLGFPGTVGDRPLKSTVPTAHTVVQGQVLSHFLTDKDQIAPSSLAAAGNIGPVTKVWQTEIDLPASWQPTDDGHLTLICTNWPVGGIMQFTTPATVEGVPLSISPVVIENAYQMVGMNFTGLQGPWSTTATILWWQGNSAAPSPSSTLHMSVLRVIRVEGQSFTGPPPKAVTAEQTRWPTFVGPDYPHLERRGPVGHQTACKLPHRLAGAHPLPLLPHVGRFDPAKREINMSPIASVIVARDCVYIEKLKNTA